MDSFLLQGFIYLAAAVVAVPLANRFGLGSVLGYLIAGVAIAPVLDWVGADSGTVQSYAEFGVVMMLFLIGLELEPRALWEMRHRLLGLGGLQIVLTTALIMLCCLILGLSTPLSLAIGLALSLSSTAIVLQTLTEKGLTKSDGGQASFSVLLTQDVAVIPILALLPLLALPEAHAMLGGDPVTGITDMAGGGSSMNLLAGQPGWVVTLSLIGAVAAVVAGGHFLTRPIFGFIAQANLPEIFTAAALLLVIGIALLMTVVGLSPALGTFLAGVVLANSEYRHQLEADVEPLKGLLLGLFFITVGAGINFVVLADDFLVIIILTLGVMGLKAGVLFGLARIFKIEGSNGWLFTLSLAQAGEFGFVLLSFGSQSGLFAGQVYDRLSLVVALSMLLTPALFIVYDRFLAGRVTEREAEADEIDETGTVIIAGLGRFGQVVNRMLLSTGHRTVVLDYRNETVTALRHFGLKGYFGDPSRPELLHAAGIKDAKVLVVAIDDREKAVEIVRYVSREYPEVKIIARAFDREHVYRLYAAGARDIVRETFDSSVRAARYTLTALGHHPFEVETVSREYVKMDRSNLAELARLWDPELSIMENEAYTEKARTMNAELEEAMRGKRTVFHASTDRAWTPPPKGGVARDREADGRAAQDAAE